MVRWRSAVALKEQAWTIAMRAAVELHDRAKRYERELLGRGTLTVQVDREATELFLFRYEDVAALHGEQSIPRLVPVPTSGVGRISDAPWRGQFQPGDECLVVCEVSEGSAAFDAGLRAGDLVLRLQGQAGGTSVFVPRAAETTGERVLSRVLEIDGKTVESLHDWTVMTSAAGSPTRSVRFAEEQDAIDCDLQTLAALDAVSVAAGNLPMELSLECLRDGRPLTLQLAAGEASGLRCEPTAYPLVLAQANRINAGEALRVDPGSYLLIARAAGAITQRIPVRVERLADASAAVDWIEQGSVPDGFVYVPGGPFIAGGDLEAFPPSLAQVVDVPAFWIARKELTNREWYEFLNDPATLEHQAGARQGTYLPRDDRIMARKNADGSFTWDVYTHTTSESPVLGLSWTDIRDYLAWRNQRAEQLGEAWRYELPSELEWEKAARGVDGRCFPWGNRFDPSLSVCMVRKPGFLLDAPGGFEPRDESPYGVLDMAGSREEWMRDVVLQSEPPRYRKRGGRWNSYVESVFRVASRAEASQDYAVAAQGFRLVLRKP
jgi:formylglycine-generating enzyme required for sulfatase activity